MRVVTFATACLVLSGPVLADAYEPVSIANWRIDRLFSSCFASNRPMAELNAADPVNVLAFGQDSEGVMLFVAYWPGATSTNDTELALALDDTTITLAAERLEGGDAFQADLSDEVLSQLVTALPGSGLMSVTTAPGGVTLWFDISALAAIMTELEACVVAAK